MVLRKQVGKRLIRQLLKAATPLAPQHINGRPGLVVELHPLADHDQSSRTPLKLAWRSMPSDVVAR